MNRSELADILFREGINPRCYGLHGGHADCTYVIDRRPDGWVVYFTERGSDSQHQYFDTEDEACRCLLNHVRADPDNYFQVVAGPLPPAEADAALGRFLDDAALPRRDLGPGDLRMWHVQTRSDPPPRVYSIRATRIPDRLRDRPHNMLNGSIRKVGIGSGVAGVVVELHGGQHIEAVIPRSAAFDLDLQDDDEVTLIIQPSDILLLKTRAYRDPIA